VETWLRKSCECAFVLPVAHMQSLKESIFSKKKMDKENTSAAATVGGEEVHGGVPQPDKINVVERDPEKMNQHLRLVFADVFAEPEPGTFSFDKVWVLSVQIFTAVKLWSYRILTLIFALPCALCWGISFGCMSFSHIWCCLPCLRACRVNLHCSERAFGLIMDSFVKPIFDATGRVFSHVRVVSSSKKTTNFEDVHLA